MTQRKDTEEQTNKQRNRYNRTSPAEDSGRESLRETPMNPQPTTDNPHDWDSQSDPKGWSNCRIQYIKCTTDFDAIDCRIIAFAELDLDLSEIAAKLNTDELTLNSRMRDLGEIHPGILTPRCPAARDVESPVGIAGTKLGGNA
jgi:hypothetical protein